MEKIQNIMQTNTKRLILAAGLSLTVACAGLVGCKSEDRTVGTRLDDRLTEHRVRESLANAPVYKFQDLHVQVYDGITQLSGFAETKEQKRYAGEIASHVQGVRQLLNDIAVKPAELVSPTGYNYGRQYPPLPPLPPMPSNPHPDRYNDQYPNNRNDLNSTNYPNQRTVNPNQP